MNFRLEAAAREELIDAFEYYEEQLSGLGGDFLDEVESAFSRIEDNPNAWAIVDEEIRRCRTRRFPYGVIYRVRDTTIEILAIMHLHREPDYWKDRI